MFFNDNHLSQRSSIDQCHLTSKLANIGPSQILPFLYLGSQEDALSIKTMQDNHITHVINVSITGDRTPFLNENDDEHFLRIPINDCHNAQLLPYLDQAYTFIEKARINKGRVFIHCLAGISRSPALAIAYIMRYLNLSADDAYRHIKERRLHISPNFNFLGQLSEYERNLSSIPKSVSTIIPMVECFAIETSFNDRRRFVQVEGCSNTNDDSIKFQTKVLPRPKNFNLDFNNNSPTFSSTVANLSDDSSQQQGLLTSKLLRPSSIALKRSSPTDEYSTIELINSNCNELTKNKRGKTILKSTDTSSVIENTDLINTFFQETKPLQQSLDSTSETNVLSSTRELLVS